MDPSYYLADQVHALAAEKRRSRLNAEYLRGLRAALEAVEKECIMYNGAASCTSHWSTTCLRRLIEAEGGKDE